MKAVKTFGFLAPSGLFTEAMAEGAHLDWKMHLVYEFVGVHAG
jgi:hypothetical protein